MNKTRQRELTRWLQQQGSLAKHWLRLSILLGLISGLLIIGQAWLLASILHALIIDNIPKAALNHYFILMIVTVTLRALLAWLRERIGFMYGAFIRQRIRKQVIDKLEQLGPVWIQGKPAGSWATLILEQIEDMQDFYSRYQPQMMLAVIIPLLILVAVFPINWAAGIILFVTAPLIPLFMALVGMGAADANRRNFVALARLSGNFLDRLRGMDTLRLFHRAKAEAEQIRQASDNFRSRTMDVLKLAFLSSAVLEFFASVSIAVAAVYFGFSYLGELNFGSYGASVTLFAGFLVLILAPEFFQPLRDLGTFYHAKAQAIGAAESLFTFLEAETGQSNGEGRQALEPCDSVTVQATNLRVIAPGGKILAGPLNFTLHPGQRIAIVGHSGAGKSSLLNLLLGFMPYQGSITVNGSELSSLQPASWRSHLSWVGQNPQLPELTLRANIVLSNPNVTDQQIELAIRRAYVDEFLSVLPNGLETEVGDHAARLSVGQAQRIAVARALLSPCNLLLLDEPTASLDANSEKLVMSSLTEAATRQTTLLVTHRLEDIGEYDQIWVMDKGQIVQQGDFSTLSQSAGLFAKLLSNRSTDI